ncbi:MAG: hypothetical protein HQ580_07405 [Planctomycetes bacterium]|nr:hypothetical protein [Planctomycetota bacterium]
MPAFNKTLLLIPILFIADPLRRIPASCLSLSFMQKVLLKKSKFTNKGAIAKCVIQRRINGLVWPC